MDPRPKSTPSAFSALIGSIQAGVDWAREELAAFTGSLRLPTARANEPTALMIAPVLPPDVTGGVYRPLSWLRNAHACGWRMVAISGPLQGKSPEAGRHLLESLPPEAEIRRAVPSARQLSWRLFPRIDGGFNEALALATEARRVGTTLKIDIVVATAPPFSSFFAGALVARALRVPLILDYRDEWSLCPFKFIERGSNDPFWEERALQAASCIIFTTQSQLDANVDRFPATRRIQRVVLPNGWDRIAWHLDESSSLERKDPRFISIGYFGFLGGHTPNRAFVQDLQSLRTLDRDLYARILLRFVGENDETAKAFLESELEDMKLEFRDMMPRNQANKLMAATDILLLLAGEELARYIPGKLYEYIASNRPVLIYGAPGEAMQAVLEAGAGIHSPMGNPGLLARTIGELAQHNDRFSGQQRKDWLQSHERDVLAKRFFEIAADVISAGRRTCME